MNEQFMTALTGFYQSALSWASPPAWGAMPNQGTAINTSEPFDAAGANNTIQSASGWFGAMQGSFNQSFAFLDQAFARNTVFQQQVSERAFGITESFGQQLIDIQAMVARRSSRRGLVSRIFG